MADLTAVDALTVVAALVVAAAVMRAVWWWCDRTDARLRARLRQDRIDADRYTINHPETLPPGTDVGRAMLKASEWGVSVAEAAYRLHAEQVMRRLKASLDPHPFDRQGRP